MGTSYKKKVPEGADRQDCVGGNEEGREGGAPLGGFAEMACNSAISNEMKGRRKNEPGTASGIEKGWVQQANGGGTRGGMAGERWHVASGVAGGVTSKRWCTASGVAGGGTMLPLPLCLDSSLMPHHASPPFAPPCNSRSRAPPPFA